MNEPRNPPYSLSNEFAPARNKDQSFGIWLNETIVSDFDKIDAAARDLARSGYGIVRAMLRNTNFTHRSPQVIETVRRLVATAHAEGMRVVLDCEPHAKPVGRDMGDLYPAAIGTRIVRAEAPVVNGRFLVHVRAPNTSGAARADFRGVEAAYIEDASGFRKLDRFHYQRRVHSESYANGFTTNIHSYTEGRTTLGRFHAHLSGEIEGVGQGRLIVYARFFDPGVIDFWAPDMRRYYDQLLECYRDIPLDGVGWDEPATGGNWQQYLYGDGFAAAFERLNGYKLADRWHLLDGGGVSSEAARVRMDYYHTLNEGVCDAQRHLFEKARELFGPRLLLGTHHTWQGEGGINDYRSGAVDYFRLNDNMDAGYTDCWWWDIKSVSYAFTLASSLGRLTPSGEAEVNTWDAKPSNSRVEFHSRLMTLLNITWFNIWYGECADTCLYPADYTWGTTVREMQRHRDGQRLIGPARPVTDVAILHGWETVCGVNDDGIASAHKAFCMNLATLFVDRSVAFDWVDSRLLAASEISGNRLVNALGSYSILILPYASILPRTVWEKVMEFAKAGGKIVFGGTPPEMDTAGGSLREEFATLMDMPELPLERYIAGVKAVCTLTTDRPERLDVCFPLDGDPARLMISTELERHGFRNPGGNVVYLSDLDPRERLLHFVEPWLSGEVICYSRSIQWKLYRDAERSILICIARQDSQMRGLIRWADHQIEITAGTSVYIENRAGEISVHGEGLEWRELNQ